MFFLERFAFDYITFAEKVPAYNFIFIGLFALVFGWLKPVTQGMQRGTYFLNSSLVLLGSSLAQGIWFLSTPAMANGYLFLIVFLDILVWAIVAYALVIITKSRSNDAYGHSRYAPLGFLPIANLWLLLTPSKESNPIQMPAWLSGVSAVLIGLVLSVASRGLNIAIENSINSYSAAAITAETADKLREKVISYKISSGGLIEAFEYIKSIENIGQNIDEITVLNDIVFSSDTITYKFFITDKNITGFTQERRDIWKNYLCDKNKQLFDNGATAIMHYFSDTQPTLAYVIGNNEVCSF